MAIKGIRRIASRITKAGKSRIRIADAEAASKAITAEDVKQLISEGKIVQMQKKGIGREKARVKKKRKAQGRRRGPGSKKGTVNARMDRKKRWIIKVRAQRKFLKKLKHALSQGAYRDLYGKVGGNNFKTCKQLENYISEHKLFKSQEEIAAGPKPKTAKPKKKIEKADGKKGGEKKSGRESRAKDSKAVK